ncbi:MAG: dynamin family protein [Bacteroidetes bacterium]|nr:dynamin family protein [Bacteroidota bacterium]
MLLETIRQKYEPKLNMLNQIVDEAKLELHQIAKLKTQLSKNYFDIAFIGEFTAGKSSIINALLNLDILPTHLEPTTARITFISYSDDPSIVVHYKNGENKTFSYEIDFLKKLVASNQDDIKDIRTIEIFLDHNLLKNGIRLIDTPGTNDTDEERVNITYGLLPEVDAVCYVTIHPITESNLEVFRKHILGNNIHNVFFILNKIDLNVSQFDLIVQDTKENFAKICNSKIKNLFGISALDYLEGKETEDFELIKKSNFIPFHEELINFLESGDRYNNLELQYANKIKSIALEAQNLLEIKIAGLSMPDDIFNEKRESLESELKHYSEQAKQLSQDAETEINQLTNKLETSLDHLLEEILEAVDLSVSNSEGSTELIIKQIEQGVKHKYDFWREKNEPVIKSYMETITEEVRIRLGKVVNNINLSIDKYTGRVSALESTNSSTPALLSNDKKAQSAISIASAGTYAVLAMLHFSIAPLAILLAPIGFYLYNKKKTEDRLAVKPKIMQEIQQNNSNFRRETLREIYQAKKSLIGEIDSTITEFSVKIKKQIAVVEKQRNEMKDSLESQSQSLNNNLQQIKANFLYE